jgi:dihydropteroate synthase
MGILNVTPDSFAEPVPLLDTEQAIEAALAMEAAGADLIDVGGESTRPGAAPVAAADEAARVMPVIRSLAGKLRVPISIDTTKAEIAREALAAGASIVNDVSGLQGGPALGKAAADAGAGLILMHMRGSPKSMYERAHYDNLPDEVIAELRGAVDTALAAGVPRERVIVDPGVGFAKRAADSYGVLARIHEIALALDLPVLVGPSRKSFLRAAAGERPAAERDWATAAAVTASVLAGAHIVRVHAVAEMVQVVRAAEEIRSAWTG